MRRLASFLLLGVALAAGAATEVWRWKDANGVVHYSDSPVPGAERVQLDTPQPSTTGARTAPAPTTPAPNSARPTQTTLPYTRCAVTDPAKDKTFRLGETVSAALAIEPDLQPGHHIQVDLNNAAYAEWPPTYTAALLNGLVRGTYTISARVLDANDRVLCTGTSVSFHIQQASLLSPARQPPKKK